ncbi:hypothetical protein ABN284_13325 [Escherichia coli]|nr:MULTISPECIES: hypothetical protein [Enterobacteriaceae]EHX89334.1 hypothetical protein ECDEC14D_3788 [Escherichia coli DEC14D]MCA8552365.1 hypothetical protein [Escherichia coli]MDI1139132.1 hypothetical protein [Escherichia coli]MDZ7129433.1 hypothetical protein [Escherichia coli]UIM03249.1 hypothetical protein LZT43_12785 [Escherichia coli]
MLEPGWWSSWTVKTTTNSTPVAPHRSPKSAHSLNHQQLLLAANTMKNHDLYESMKEEARLILSETKRFQTISEKNPISYEAADLLASLRNRLNAFEHMTDEAGRIMRDEAESHASTLERKKWQPSSRISSGERAKRQAVKRGAILVRSA